jgi:hypothetical protein
VRMRGKVWGGVGRDGGSKMGKRECKRRGDGRDKEESGKITGGVGGWGGGVDGAFSVCASVVHIDFNKNCSAANKGHWECIHADTMLSDWPSESQSLVSCCHFQNVCGSN